MFRGCTKGSKATVSILSVSECDYGVDSVSWGSQDLKGAQHSCHGSLPMLGGLKAKQWDFLTGCVYASPTQLVDTPSFLLCANTKNRRSK